MRKVKDPILPNRTDGKKTKILRSNRPIKNVISREEVFRQLREDIKQNPELAKGMSRQYKKKIGIT